MLSERRKNLAKLLLIIFIFIFPLLVAHYMFYYGNIIGGSSNKGLLITEPHNISELNVRPLNYEKSDAWLDKKWHVLYLAPSNCNKTCSNILYRLEQVQIATGKNSNRVQRVNIHPIAEPKQLDKTWLDAYNKHQHMTMLSSESDYKLVGKPGAELGAKLNIDIDSDKTQQNSILNILDKNNIYIADPLGNIILSYSIKADGIEDFDSKIFKDLKKLLNISNIG